ncbi:hypothetical protein MMC24_000247 [Lignoscripta atroalba]|nr:hypothetical protein [Lignoscripta atroalba]
MEVKNASGRKVSLLNDTPSAYFSHPPSRAAATHSRKSSRSTQMSREGSASSHSSSLASPNLSPRTPQLRRLDSTSSQDTLPTPSPMTPNYPFEPLEQTKTVTPRDPYYRANGSYYPAMPQPQEVAAQPYYNVPMRQGNDLLMEDAYQQLSRSSIQSQYSYAASEPVPPLSPQAPLRTSIPAPSTSTSQNAPTTSNNTPKSSKKKYPCPHAQRYSCTDTFTTSGHAARHGKKHTGEKNILCPTCNKAFTRKDNMKQHERTHKPGRELSSSTKASTSGTPAMLAPENRESHNHSRRRLKLSHSRSTTAPSTPVQPSATMEIDNGGIQSRYQEMYEDGGMVSSSRPQFRRSSLSGSLHYSNLSIDTALAEGSRPGMERSSSGTSQDGEGESPGLDALAMAASGLSA